MLPQPSHAVDFVTLGFHVSDAPANRMAKPHRHDEIEITVLEVGWIEYLFGGRRIRNRAGELCVRWAAIPHQSVDFDPGGIHYSLKVPLAWFLNWRLPESLVNRLLGGEMLIEKEPDPGCSDLAMLRRWHAAFISNDPDGHRMILLEAEARLLRMALRQQQAGQSTATSGIAGHLGKFERMTVFIAGNYTCDIDVADVAAAAGMHPNSAMRLFRQTCGLTVPNIPLIELDAMPRQQCPQLILKRHLAMVLPLMLDISSNVGNIRLAHRKGGEPILPMEVPVFCAICLHPFRTARIHLFDDLPQRVVLG
jgi:AraC-like DNA-binding protein